MSSNADLVRAMVRFQEERRTGVATIFTEGVTTFAYFRDGTLIFAEEGTQGETLGRMLVRLGQLTQAQYVQIIRDMTDALVLNEQLRFGEVAVELGYLTEDEVRTALANQIRWKVVRSLQRADATWTFEDSVARLEDVGNFPTPIEALVLEAMRWLDDDSKMDFGLARALDQAPYLTPEAAGVLATHFGMSAAERDFAARLDGRVTIRQLLAEVNNEVDAPAILTALVLTRAARATKPARPQGAPLPPLEAPPQALARTPPGVFVAAREAAHAPAPPPPAAPRAPASPPAAAAAYIAPLARALEPEPEPEPAPAPAPTTPLAQRAAPPAEPAPASSPRPLTAAGGPAHGAPARMANPFTRTAKILEALEAKRVKVDIERDPATDHEARLLAERAFQTGLEQVKAGRPAQAAPDLLRAAQLQPKSNEYRLYAKWCAVRTRGELPHAAELAELSRLAVAALAADPNHAFANYVAGDMALANAKNKDALRMLKRAVKLDPNLLDAQRLLRIAERRVGGG